MLFEQRKIEIETLNEYLLQARLRLNLSVSEAAAQARIKPEFLAGLESGEFKALPPDVYVFGFLRQLAEVYGVQPQALIIQYKKEKNIVNQIQKREQAQRGRLGGYWRNLVITPKSLGVVLGAVFVVATLAYIVWQVSAINKTPSLEISQPQDRQSIAQTFVKVQGKTDPGMSVTVNGQEVFVDNSGAFTTQLGIEPGPEKLEIVASNKYGKTAVREISVVGQAGLLASSTPVSLKLEFSGDVTLGYVIDGQPAQQLAFHNGDVKTLNGQAKIVISTSDGGATVATLNGKKLGQLGRAGEKLANIPFYPDNSGGK